MLSNYAWRYANALDALRNLRALIESDGWPTRGSGSSPKDVANRMVAPLLGYFLEMGLQTALTQLGFFLEDIEKGLSPAALAASLSEIDRHIQADMRHVFFEPVPDKKKPHYETTFGPEIESAFPSATAEIREGCTCYSLGRNTACVFHLIRASEFGLRALAGAVGISGGIIPIEYETWGGIIGRIEKAIEPINKWAKGKEKDNALEFYKGALSDFHFFKDAIRNRIMHTRSGLYDENGAAEMLARTKLCMARLAARIAENQSAILLAPSDFSS